MITCFPKTAEWMPSDEITGEARLGGSPVAEGVEDGVWLGVCEGD